MVTFRLQFFSLSSFSSLPPITPLTHPYFLLPTVVIRSQMVTFLNQTIFSILSTGKILLHIHIHIHIQGVLHDDINIKWRILAHRPSFKASNNTCRLCLQEKYILMHKPEEATINARCLHKHSLLLWSVAKICLLVWNFWHLYPTTIGKLSYILSEDWWFSTMKLWVIK